MFAADIKKSIRDKNIFTSKWLGFMFGIWSLDDVYNFSSFD